MPRSAKTATRRTRRDSTDPVLETVTGLRAAPGELTTPEPATPFDHLSPAEMRQLLVRYTARQKLGLYWEHDEIERERAINADVPFVHLVTEENGQRLVSGQGPWANVVIEADNFDALRLLRRTHKGRVRVICVDPPYNRGKKDLVYNDRYIRKEDRLRHSMWLEHLYQRFDIARDLLTADGVMLVFINDENRAKLEMLLDQVMPGLRIGSFVWRTRSGSNDITGARLSVDHEHVLVYGRKAFAFRGVEKDFADYVYDDNDGRGLWASKDLSTGVAYDDPRAGNAYYPLQNPATGVWYPCNPNRVWAYVPRDRAAADQTFKSFTMDDLIREERIKWPSADDRVVVWPTLEALYEAIDRGDVPKAKTVPLLRRGMPEMEAWVGRPVGFGRPRLKRYRLEMEAEKLHQPVSSWIRPESEDARMADDDEIELVAAHGEEGGQVLQEMFGRKVFQYPKPPSLVRELLRQATAPGDIVLDFYAGSATTAHAVMDLNAEDAATNPGAVPRTFIMVSNTEATEDEPTKNICRDVCTERVRLKAEGYGNTPGLGGSHAYLRLTKIAAEDVPFEATPEMIWHTLTLLHARAVTPFPGRPVNIVTRSGHSAVVYCPRVSSAALKELAAMQIPTMTVYSDRPQVVLDALQRAGVSVDSKSALEAAIMGGAA